MPLDDLGNAVTAQGLYMHTSKTVEPPIGTRVLAILSADKDKIHVFGEGTYEGMETPPAPYGMHAAAFGAETWEEYDATLRAEIKHLREEQIKLGVDVDLPPEDWTPARPTNPKIKLDNGTIIWGYECWWAPVEEAMKVTAGRRVVMVDVEQYRAGLL